MGLPAPPVAARAKLSRQRRMCLKRWQLSTRCAPGARIPHLSKLKSNYIDALRCWPMQTRASTPPFRQRRRLLAASHRSIQTAEYSHPHGAGPRDSCRVYGVAGTQLLSPITRRSNCACSPLQRRSAARQGLCGEHRHSYMTASEVFGVPAESMDKETRGRAKAVNFGIVYGISPSDWPRSLAFRSRKPRLHRSLLRALRRRSGVH